MELTDFDKLTTVTTDDRGRATLGSEFANEQVQVYVQRVPEVGELEEPPEDEKELISKMFSWGFTNDINVFDARPREGVIVDVNGTEHETPYQLERTEECESGR